MATCEYDLDLSGGLMEVRFWNIFFMKVNFLPVFAIFDGHCRQIYSKRSLFTKNTWSWFRGWKLVRCKLTNLLPMHRVLNTVSPTYLIVPGWWLGLFVNLDPEVEIYLQGTSSVFFSYLSFTHCFVDDTKMINIRRGLKLHPLEQKYLPTNLP